MIYIYINELCLTKENRDTQQEPSPFSTWLLLKSTLLHKNTNAFVFKSSLCQKKYVIGF